MKLVVLDGYTENPGDLSWAALEVLGELTVYDRTSYTESPLIAERIGDAEIVVMNKTPISRATIDACPNIRLIAVLATGYNVVDYNYAREKGIPVVNVPAYGISAITARLSMRAIGPRIPTGAIGTIRSSSWRARLSASSALAASARRRAASRGRWACTFWHMTSIRTTPGAPSARMSIWTRCLRSRTWCHCTAI